MLKVSSQNTYYPGKQLFAVLVFKHTASTTVFLMSHEVLNNRFETVMLTFYCCWDSIVQKCHISRLKKPKSRTRTHTHKKTNKKKKKRNKRRTQPQNSKPVSFRPHVVRTKRQKRPHFRAGAAFLLSEGRNVSGKSRSVCLLWWAFAFQEGGWTQKGKVSRNSLSIMEGAGTKSSSFR